MSINCLIVDDEPLARELLQAYVSKLPGLALAGSCENALQAHNILLEGAVDLMFLDIEMPLLKGNAFLAGLASPPAVILTTAYREYALQGYELDVVDYLLKPIVFERFFKAVDKFTKQHLERAAPAVGGNDDAVFVQQGSRHIRVARHKILFVESAKDYITIHLEGEPALTVKQNISAFQQQLDGRFLRVHRSFIFNTQQIASFSKWEISIAETVIPVGDSFQEDWKQFSERLVRGR